MSKVDLSHELRGAAAILSAGVDDLVGGHSLGPLDLQDMKEAVIEIVRIAEKLKSHNHGRQDNLLP